MEPIYSPQAGKPVRAQLETMEDVAIAETAIREGKSAVEDRNDKNYQKIGHIQTVYLVTNPDYLPTPLSFHQTEDAVRGLEIVADNELQRGPLTSEVAAQWLGKLGIREEIEPRFTRTSIPIRRVLESEVEVTIQQLQDLREPTAA